MADFMSEDATEDMDEDMADDKAEDMDEDIAAIGGVVSARRGEHQSTVYRLKGAEKVEEHVKLQHFIDLENQRAMELEDAASANRSSASNQSHDEVDL